MFNLIFTAAHSRGYRHHSFPFFGLEVTLYCCCELEILDLEGTAPPTAVAAALTLYYGVEAALNTDSNDVQQVEYGHHALSLQGHPSLVNHTVLLQVGNTCARLWFVLGFNQAFNQAGVHLLPTQGVGSSCCCWL